ncbi:MAG: ECF-type sigma factor [Pseudomonadota bacterium]
MSRETEITRMLNEWRTGDAEHLQHIIPAVYDELHRVANAYMRGQPENHTLQATALVNEAFLRIGDIKAELNDRGHFVGIVANVMRQILVEHARAKFSQKRGGNIRHQSLEEMEIAGPFSEPSVDVLALESVLEKLAKKDPRKVQIAEIYFFCGATYAETAAAMAISEATLHRELRLLKALLARQLSLNTPQRDT